MNFDHVGPDDPRLADYARLVDARYRVGYEQAAGIFVVEGHLAVRRALESPYVVRSLLVALPRRERLASLIDAAAHAGACVLLADQAVMTEVTGFNVHRGVLAIGQRISPRAPADVLTRPGVVLAVEGCNDGENMGALGRVAAAFGAAGLVLDPTCCDPLSRRAVRVSVGHILGLPLARAAPWPDALFESGPEVVALTPRSDAVTLADFTEGRRSRTGPTGTHPRRPATVVVLVGAEGAGLSDQVMARSTSRVRIPMAPGVDSLNVASAAAVALSHLTSLRDGPH